MFETEEFCKLCSTEDNKVRLLKCSAVCICPNENCIYSTTIWNIAEKYNSLSLISRHDNNNGYIDEIDLESSVSPPPSNAAAVDDNSSQSVVEAEDANENSAVVIPREPKPSWWVGDEGICSMYAKFLPWPNHDTMCWLNATLSLLIHSRRIKLLVDSGDISHCQISRVYDDYHKVLEKLNGDQKLTVAYAFVSKRLREIQEYVFAFLQKNLHCVKGQQDSPVFSLPLLLKENSKIKHLFEFNHWWDLKCQNCTGPKVFSSVKTIVSFSKIAEDFSVNNPVSMSICKRCLTSHQKRVLCFEGLPECILFHFENGLPHDDITSFDFETQGQKYMVKGFILYTNIFGVKHFATHIRDLRNNTWLNCSELESGFPRFLPGVPRFKPEDLHIIMWERVDVLPPAESPVDSPQNLVIDDSVDCEDSMDTFPSVKPMTLRSSNKAADENTNGIPVLPKNLTQLDPDAWVAPKLIDFTAPSVEQAKSSVTVNNSSHPNPESIVNAFDSPKSAAAKNPAVAPAFPIIKLPSFKSSLHSFSSIRKSMMNKGLFQDSARELSAPAEVPPGKSQLDILSQESEGQICDDGKRVPPEKLQTSPESPPFTERGKSNSNGLEKMTGCEFLEPDGTMVKMFNPSSVQGEPSLANVQVSDPGPSTEPAGNVEIEDTHAAAAKEKKNSSKSSAKKKSKTPYERPKKQNWRKRGKQAKVALSLEEDLAVSSSDPDDNENESFASRLKRSNPLPLTEENNDHSLECEDREMDTTTVINKDSNVVKKASKLSAKRCNSVALDETLEQSPFEDEGDSRSFETVSEPNKKLNDSLAKSCDQRTVNNALQDAKAHKSKQSTKGSKSPAREGLDGMSSDKKSAKKRSSSYNLRGQPKASFKGRIKHINRMNTMEDTNDEWLALSSGFSSSDEEWRISNKDSSSSESFKVSESKVKQNASVGTGSDLESSTQLKKGSTLKSKARGGRNAASSSVTKEQPKASEELPPERTVVNVAASGSGRSSETTRKEENVAVLQSGPSGSKPDAQVVSAPVPLESENKTTNSQPFLNNRALLMLPRSTPGAQVLTPLNFPLKAIGKNSPLYVLQSLGPSTSASDNSLTNTSVTTRASESGPVTTPTMSNLASSPMRSIFVFKHSLIPGQKPPTFFQVGPLQSAPQTSAAESTGEQSTSVASSPRIGVNPMLVGSRVLVNTQNMPKASGGTIANVMRVSADESASSGNTLTGTPNNPPVQQAKSQKLAKLSNKQPASGSTHKKYSPAKLGDGLSFTPSVSHDKRFGLQRPAAIKESVSVPIVKDVIRTPKVVEASKDLASVQSATPKHQNSAPEARTTWRTPSQPRKTNTTFVSAAQTASASTSLAVSQNSLSAPVPPSSSSSYQSTSRNAGGSTPLNGSGDTLNALVKSELGSQRTKNNSTGRVPQGMAKEYLNLIPVSITVPATTYAKPRMNLKIEVDSPDASNDADRSNQRELNRQGSNEPNTFIHIDFNKPNDYKQLASTSGTFNSMGQTLTGASHLSGITIRPSTSSTSVAPQSNAVELRPTYSDGTTNMAAVASQLNSGKCPRGLLDNKNSNTSIKYPGRAALLKLSGAKGSEATESARVSENRTNGDPQVMQMPEAPPIASTSASTSNGADSTGASGIVDRFQLKPLVLKRVPKTSQPSTSTGMGADSTDMHRGRKPRSNSTTRKRPATSSSPVRTSPRSKKAVVSKYLESSSEESSDEPDNGLLSSSPSRSSARPPPTSSRRGRPSTSSSQRGRPSASANRPKKLKQEPVLPVESFMYSPSAVLSRLLNSKEDENQ